MRKPPTSAFTLLEMLTVLAIIVILAGLVLAVGGYVQKKSALSRASGEIAMLSSACESYKSDNGAYPRDIPTNGTGVTDAISPKTDFIPTDVKYSNSSLFLYKELTGDKTANGKAGSLPDGIPDEGEPRYMKEFESRILKATKNPTTKVITEVKYIQDPFGFPYAYSTAAAKDEQDYQTKVLQEPDPVKKKNIPRPTGTTLHGFNLGSFDLWSTGGSSVRSNPTSDTAKDLEWAKWVKNW
jgi:prepilin-type N-terminal cleavage/methylation domain-containing protein